MTDQVELTIRRARRKLREARFFLKRMQGDDENRNDSEVFGYYMSAFLSATVSAFYALHDVAGEAFKPWWRQRRDRLSMTDRQLWNFMFGARGSEVHELGLIRSRTASITLSSGFAVAGESQRPPSEEPAEPEWSATPWRFEERLGRGEAEIVPLAEAFLRLWEQIVGEFEEEQRGRTA